VQANAFVVGRVFNRGDLGVTATHQTVMNISPAQQKERLTHQEGVATIATV
jgi:hypothetical protein